MPRDLLTYLRLKKYRTIRWFLNYARRLEAQLAETKGHAQLG